MFRSTISIPDDIAKYIEDSPKNVSETIQDLIFDYQYALLYNNINMHKDKKIALEAYLADEIFKVQRLFDAENNTDYVSGFVSIIQYNDYPFTKELGIDCIEQVIKLNSLHTNHPFFRKCLCEKMIVQYLDQDGLVQLKEYHSYLLDADKLALKIRKDEVQEVFVYKDNELVDYFRRNARLSTFKKSIENLTNAEWIITDKTAGNSDCSLIRK